MNESKKIEGSQFYVIKRDGTKERFKSDKIQARIESMMDGLDLRYVNGFTIFSHVIQSMVDKMTTSDLDVLTASVCHDLMPMHYHYGTLAARLTVSNLHKETHGSFLRTVKTLHNNYIVTNNRADMQVNEDNADIEVENYKGNGEHCPLVSRELYNIALKHQVKIEQAIDYTRDYMFDYFGIMTLLHSYLIKIGSRVIERPQDMYMRVALGIFGEDIDAAINWYTLLSKHYVINATPTLQNAGTCQPGLSSCFLVAMQEDSLDGIFDTLKVCAFLSRSSGGIGLSVHNIRAKGSYIRGTNGTSNGIIPMLRVYNNTARYVDQGGGKRKGGFVVYIEPWHADIHEFLNLRKNTGTQEMRTHDLFLGLWVPDLFMKRVLSNGKWSLMCPDSARGLCEVWGSEFEALYEKYEKDPSKVRKVIDAVDLYAEILTSLEETGTPYILFKDTCNAKSNQKALGTIKSSNLCTEIIEFTSKDEVAVCNLGSIALPKFVRLVGYGDDNKVYDFALLEKVAYDLAVCLDKVIDRTSYPVKEASNSNFKHRPMGIGVQGLDTTFKKLRYPFESKEAAKLNEDIFETICYGALRASIDLAKKNGPYASYSGSPASHGILQFDMWGYDHIKNGNTRYDWSALKGQMKLYGLRNSLLVAPMPTASTSNILGNTEAFEPVTSNFYQRRVDAGNFYVINPTMIDDLVKLGLWNNDMKTAIVDAKGSLSKFTYIPEEVRALHKTVWEIKQKNVIDMAVARGKYVCQSQSMNIHMSRSGGAHEEPLKTRLSKALIYGWEKGLKTGVYYFRTLAVVDPIKVTVPVGFVHNADASRQEEVVEAVNGWPALQENVLENKLKFLSNYKVSKKGKLNLGGGGDSPMINGGSFLSPASISDSLSYNDLSNSPITVNTCTGMMVDGTFYCSNCS